MLGDLDARVSIDGRYRWYEFSLKEVALVAQISVTATGYNDLDRFEFGWIDENGSKQSANAVITDGVATYAVNSLCTGLAFRPPAKLLSFPKIEGVLIEGVSRERIPIALQTLADIEGRVNEINSSVAGTLANASAAVDLANQAEVSKTQLEEAISELEEERDGLNEEISELQTSKASWIAEKGNADRDIEQAQDRVKDLQSDSKALEEQRAEVKSDISAKSGELAQLKSNINIFPSELVAFADQGAKSVQLYFLLALIPIIIIAYIFGLLINGAEQLSTIFTRDQSFNIVAVLLSRLPYVTISVAIVAACYKISKVFLEETVRINRQRLNLTKISIIAKDVTYASADGLDLDDDEIFQKRTELKMALLRDHLKTYLSDDPSLGLPKSIAPKRPLLVSPETTVKELVDDLADVDEDNEEGRV